MSASRKYINFFLNKQKTNTSDGERLMMSVHFFGFGFVNLNIGSSGFIQRLLFLFCEFEYWNFGFDLVSVVVMLLLFSSSSSVDCK